MVDKRGLLADESGGGGIGAAGRGGYHTIPQARVIRVCEGSGLGL